MFSYKMKNYVLLDERGKLLIKGSGLRSRGIELFQRLWMEEMFRLLLTGRREEIPALVERWEEDFRAHRVPLKQFMKTETLQESLAGYQDKLQAGARNVAARPTSWRCARRARTSRATRSPTTSTGEGKRVKVNEAAKLAAEWSAAAPDENTAYYVAKLQELYEKFRPLIEQDGLVARRRGRAAPAAARAGQPLRLRRDRPHQTSESWRGRAGASARTRSSRRARREADLARPAAPPAARSPRGTRAGRCRAPDRARGSAASAHGNSRATKSRKKRHVISVRRKSACADRLARARREGGGQQLAQARVAVGQQRQHRHEEEARRGCRRRPAPRMASSRRSGRGARGSICRRSAASSEISETLTHEVRAARDAGQELAVAQDAGGLGGEPDPEPGHARHRLEHAPGHREARLGRLVGIGRGPDRDLLPGLARPHEARAAACRCRPA